MLRVHDDRALVERRIARELWERVVPLVEIDRAELAIEAGPSLDRLTRFAVGSRWGAPWGTTWFRLTGEIPDRWAGRRVEAVIDLGFHRDAAGFQCEGLVSTISDGRSRDPPAHEMPSTRSRDRSLTVGRLEPVIPRRLRPSSRSPATPARSRCPVPRAELVVVAPIEARCTTPNVSTVDAPSRSHPRRRRVLRDIERALDLVPDVAAARHAVEAALALPARSAAHRIIATGHAHIDTAWLWPARETQRKCERTFASAVRLMDEYPEYRFASRPAVRVIEQRPPELFARIAAKVRTGNGYRPVGCGSSPT